MSMSPIKPEMSLARWQQLLEGLGLPAEDQTYTALVSAYGEPHRHYHTGRHIAHCLTELDFVRKHAAEPAEIEMALWFHDAVYDTHRADNERLSAQWAERFLRGHGLPPERVQRISDHILATCHSGTPNGADSQLTVDADLAILGASAADSAAGYPSFERDVRQEYSWVPEAVFKAKRAEILESFLARPCIYHSAFFRDRHEAAARVNLAHAIRALRS